MRFVDASPEAIAEAAQLLRGGALVAFPTETVYGLGGDATSEIAVARIFAAKRRPQFNPLISHLPDRRAADGLARFDDRAEALAARFWPGALTLVLPRTDTCPIARLASAGLDSVALRVPDHPVAHALLRAAGRPIAAPSANLSGRLSPTRAADVAEGLGDAVALILDGGPCRIGLESTVVGLVGPALLLRPGGVTREAIEAVIGPVGVPDDGEAAPVSPGRLLSHYAPALPLRLDATGVTADEALLAFGPRVPAGAALTRNLSPSGDLVEAAANLFRMLRDLDRPGLRGIAAMPVPQQGLGAAINDRLRRAAAPRD